MIRLNLLVYYLLFIARLIHLFPPKIHTKIIVNERISVFIIIICVISVFRIILYKKKYKNNKKMLLND